MGVQLVKIVKEICKENNLLFHSFSDDYLLVIENDNKKMFILGNKFPNNNAGLEQICNDKSALSDLLTYYGINHVPHYYLLNPQISLDENYLDLPNELLSKYKELVLKPNRGTGGKNVLRAHNKNTLKKAIDELFTKTNSIAICPYIDIKNEYRVLVLNGKVCYAFMKIKPYVTGDGVHKLNELISSFAYKDKLNSLDFLDLNYIPKINEKIELSWKHNLGSGATPKLVTDLSLLKALEELALNCANKIDVKFASIDIIEKEDLSLEILEINSGVMIENFSSYNNEYYNLALNAIKEAILSYLNK